MIRVTAIAAMTLTATFGIVQSAYSDTATAPATTRPTEPATTKPAPATRPARAPTTGPFIPLLPETPDSPTAPTSAPSSPGADSPKPPSGVFIKPVPEPGEPPATAPAEPPTTAPAATQSAATQSAAEAPTVGFSPWVVPPAQTRCVPLDALPADVGQFWAARATTTGRALAERAARNAARAALADHFDAMEIAPDLTVRQLIETTNEPNAPATKFLGGAAVRAVRYHVSELTVEVAMEIGPRTFVASLKGWARVHGATRGNLAKLERLLLTADNTPVRRTGAAGATAKPSATAGAVSGR